MKKFISFLLSISIVFSLCACGSSGKPAGSATKDDPMKIRINCYDGNYNVATLQIIKHEKLLEKYLPENVTVEYTSLTSAPEIRDALVSGDIQMAELSLISVQTALENNIPLNLISFCGFTVTRLYTNNASGISDLKELSSSDKLTITNRATGPHAAYLAMLQEESVDIPTYDSMLVPTPNTEALALLSDGSSVTGSVLTFPTYLKAEAMDNVTMIYDMNEVAKKYNIGSAFVCMGEFYENNPEILSAFRKAQDDAMALIENDPEYVAELLAGLYNSEPEIILEVLNEMPPTASLAGYDKYAKLMYDVGILKQKPMAISEMSNYDDLKPYVE